MNDKQILRTINGALDELGLSKFSSSKLAVKLMRTYFPYCVLPGGFVVNREYKPLGVAGYDLCVNYEDYPCKASSDLVVRMLNVVQALHMSDNGGVMSVHLYSDDSAPYKSKSNFEKYMAKLDEIMQMCDTSDISEEWESLHSMNDRYGEFLHVMEN